MNNQGWKTKEIENKPRLINFNLNFILTCLTYRYIIGIYSRNIIYDIEFKVIFDYEVP